MTFVCKHCGKTYLYGDSGNMEISEDTPVAMGFCSSNCAFLWKKERLKLQEAAFMKGQELFKNGNFERR